jgi:hypothetical protein
VIEEADHVIGLITRSTGDRAERTFHAQHIRAGAIRQLLASKRRG